MYISIFDLGYCAPHLLSITRHAASPCLASQGESSIPSPPRFTLKIVQKCFRYWITPKINVGPDCMVRVFQIINDDHPLLFVVTSPRIIWLSQNVSFKTQLAEVFEQRCTLAYNCSPSRFHTTSYHFHSGVWKLHLVDWMVYYVTPLVFTITQLTYDSLGGIWSQKEGSGLIRRDHFPKFMFSLNCRKSHLAEQQQ